jgi:anthraniloyl-CoA monooxygenase
MGEQAGFDMIELHAAHGYLLSSFITPLTNKRTDDYGGSLENRLRFPLEVFRAMRDAWPATKPMAVRISANDWMGDQGVTPADAVEIARAFAEAGADLIDVSAGQTWAECAPVYGRMFQTPFGRPHPQRGAAFHHGRRQHLRTRPCQFDPRRRPRRSRRPRPSPPRGPDVDLARRRRPSVSRRPRPPPYLGGMAQLARNLQREQEMALKA